MAQGVDPEFKPQSHQKKKKKRMGMMGSYLVIPALRRLR
jgi:hypothetical protein